MKCILFGKKKWSLKSGVFAAKPGKKRGKCGTGTRKCKFRINAIISQTCKQLSEVGSRLSKRTGDSLKPS